MSAMQTDTASAYAGTVQPSQAIAGRRAPDVGSNFLRRFLMIGGVALVAAVSLVL